MKNKIVVRTVIGLFAIALLYLGYAWLKEWTKDPDMGSTDTTDMIAAVEYTEGGSKIVLFDSEGKKTDVPGFVEDRSDVDPVWRPDGQRVFFSSNRNGTSNNIFRWNVATNKVEQRLESSRSASSPHFGPSGWEGVADSALITFGGQVFQFNQTDKRAFQLLPPSEFSNADQAQLGQLEALYERMGLSFKSAKWGKDRKVMYTVMRRENDEVFLLNYMEQVGDHGMGPVPLLAGQNIQFDVGPDGTAVVAIQGFEFTDPNEIPEQFMQGGKAYKPWRNGLVAINIDDNGEVVSTPIFFDQADLGILPEVLNAENRAEFGIPANVNGVLVRNVMQDSAGLEIGLVPGSVIVSIGQNATPDPDTMYGALTQIRIGTSANVTYWSPETKANKTVLHLFGSESSMAMRDPSVSPDGKRIAVVFGMVIDKYTFDPRQLLIVPMQEAGINASLPLTAGRIFEPSWHPSGNKLVFVMVGPSGDSQIYTINADGSDQKNVSGAGEFASPKFSPMLKKG